jgi:hypothetical protein
MQTGTILFTVNLNKYSQLHCGHKHIPILITYFDFTAVYDLKEKFMDNILLDNTYAAPAPIMLVKLESLFPELRSSLLSKNIFSNFTLTQNDTIKWAPLYGLMEALNYVDRFDLDTIDTKVVSVATDKNVSRFEVQKDVEYVLDLTSFLIIKHLEFSTLSDLPTEGENNLKLPDFNLKVLFPQWRHPENCTTTLEKIIKTVIWNEGISETVFVQYLTGNNFEPATATYYQLLRKSHHMNFDSPHTVQRMDELIRLNPNMWQQYLKTKPTLSNIKTLYGSELPLPLWREYTSLPPSWVNRVVT